jgi:hypothetical protein
MTDQWQSFNAARFGVGGIARSSMFYDERLDKGAIAGISIDAQLHIAIRHAIHLKY